MFDLGSVFREIIKIVFGKALFSVNIIHKG